MTSLYEALRPSPNYSERLMRYVKRHGKGKRLYGRAASHVKASTKKEVATLNLRDMVIDISYPYTDRTSKRRSIIGRDLGQLIHGWGQERMLVLDKPKWVVDITDRFIEEYNKFGPCAFSNGYHRWPKKVGKTRTCVFCGHTEKKVIKTIKQLEWVDVEETK